MAHLEISREIHKWLVENDILSMKVRYSERGANKFELDDATTRKFNNAVLIYKIFEKCFGSQLAEFLRKNPLLSQNMQTSATRSHNWKIIAAGLEKLNVNISKDVITQIVAGDIQFISEVLNELKKLLSFNPNNTSLERANSMSGESEFDDSPRKINQSSKTLKSLFDYSSTSSIVKRNTLLPIISRNESSILVGRAKYKREKMLKALAKSQTEPLDLVHVDVNKNLNNVKKGLEFLIIAISKNFNLKATQAATLLSYQTKYMAHIMMKGLKGDFEPILKFYAQMEDNIQLLADFCVVDPTMKNFDSILQLFKPGITSKNYTVAKTSCEFLRSLAASLIDRNLGTQLWEWVISPNGLLSAWVNSVGRYADLVEFLISTMELMSGNEYESFLLEVLPNYFSDPKDYLKLLHKIFRELCKHEKSKNILEKNINNFLDYCLNLVNYLNQEQAQHTADISPKKNSDNTKLITMISMIDYFTNLNHLFIGEENNLRKNKFLTNFKQLFITKSMIFKMQGACHLMNTIEFLLKADQQKFAENFYKIFVNIYVEDHLHSSFRFLLTELFLDHLKRYNISMIFSLICDPILKIMSASEGMHFIIQLSDVILLCSLTNQVVINLKNLIPLLELLLKLYLNNVYYSNYIFLCLTKIMDKFKDEVLIHEFIGKSTKSSLNIYYNSLRKMRPLLKLDIISKIKQMMIDEERVSTKNFVAGIKSPKAGAKINGLNFKDLETEKIQSHKRSLIIELIKMFIERKIQKIRSGIRNYLLYSNILLKDLQLEDETVIKPVDNKGILALLKLYGDPKKIMAKYEQVAEFKILQGLNTQIDDQSNVSVFTELPIKGKNGKGGFELRHSAMTKEKLYAMAKRKGVQADPRIAKVLTDIRNDYLQKLEAEKKQKDTEEINLKNQMEFLKKKIEQRNIELGVPTRNEEIEKAIIQKFDSIPDVEEEKKKAIGCLTYKVFDVDDEEESVREALQLLLDNFRPAVRVVYDKLSKQSMRNVGDDFGSILKSSLFIHRKQILQFVNDHSLRKFIQKEQLYTLVRDVKVKLMGDQIEVMTLDYEGFVRLLLNLACFIFSQSSFGMGHLPSSYLLHQFIEHLKKIWAYQGYSTLIFTEPEAINYIDPEVILYLNKELKKRKDVEIPKMLETYQKYELEFVYSLPECLKIKSTFKMCYDIVDDLVYKLYDFHFLPLRHKYKKITKVRAKPFFEINQMKRNKLNDISNKKRESVQSLYINNNLGKTQKTIEDNQMDLEFIVKELPMNYRVELANFSLQDRSKAIECAFCLDKLFSTVHQKKKTVSFSSIHLIATIDNTVKKRKEFEKKELKNQELENDKKFYKHKSELDSMKESIKKFSKDKKREMKLLEKKEESNKKQAEKNRLAKLMEFWEPKMENVKKVKLKHQSEIDLIQQENAMKNKLLEEQRKDEFNKFKENEIAKLKSYMIKKNQQRLNLTLQYENSAKEFDQKLEKNTHFVIKHIPEGLDSLAKAKQFNKDIINIFDLQQVQGLFVKWFDELEITFNFFVKNQYYAIGVPLQSYSSEMRTEGLFRFLNQFGLVPYLIKFNKALSIFKWICREKPVIDKAESGLTFIEFQLFLLRVVILNQDHFEKVYKDHNQQQQEFKEEIPKPLASSEQEQEADINNEESVQHDDYKEEEDNEEEEEKNIENKELQQNQQVSKESLEGLFIFLALPKDKKELKKKLIREKKENTKILPNKIRMMQTKAGKNPNVLAQTICIKAKAEKEHVRQLHSQGLVVNCCSANI